MAHYIGSRCIGTVRARTQLLINQSINCTVPAFSPSQLLNLSLSKILKSRSMTFALLGTVDEDRWPCGCCADRASKQVCSFVFHCHRQPLCGHRTAQKMEACCVWKNAAVKQPSVRSLLFKTERFIPAAATAVSHMRQKSARAR